MCCERRSGQLLTGIPSALGDECPAVVACIPESNRGQCLLVAEGADPPGLRLAAHDRAGALLGLGMRLVNELHHVSLFHPFSHRWLCAGPPDPANQCVGVGAVSTRLDESGMFVLYRADDAAISRNARNWIREFVRLTTPNMTVDALVALLELTNSRDARHILGAICPFLTHSVLQGVGRLLLGNRRLHARLAALLPEDVWASDGLPRLAEHKAYDFPPSKLQKYQIGVELDFLAEAGFNGSFASPGHLISAYARATVTPLHELCVVSTARNEGVYLLEWLAYHRAIGVEHFFLYSNDNHDGSDMLLSVLADAGVITWIDNQVRAQTSAQEKAYGHAFSLLPDVLDYRWAAVIDVDEYLVFNPIQFDSIREFLRWHDIREADAIACNWVYVGSGRFVTVEELLTRRNRRLLGPQHVGPGYRLVKTISRPSRIIHSRPHDPITDARRQLVSRYSDGGAHSGRNAPPGLAPMAFADSPNTDYACVYHYMFKSAEEFLWKLCRNRGDHPLRKGFAPLLDQEMIDTYMRQHYATDVGASNQIDLCAPEIQSELSRLASLPGVSQANAAVQAEYRRLLAAVRQVLRSEALGKINPVTEKFLQLARVSDAVER